MWPIRILLLLILQQLTWTGVTFADDQSSEVFGKLKSGLHTAKLQFQEMSYCGVWKWRQEKTTYQIGVFRGSFFIENEVGQETQPEVFRVKNPHYAFEVVKNKVSDGYSISWIGQNSDPQFTEQVARNEAGLLRTLIQTYFIDGWFLWDIVDHQNFEPIEVIEDGELVRCEFRFAPPKTGLAFREWPIYGYFKCDPQQSWAMVEYCKWAEDKTTGLIVKIDTASSKSILPVPKLVLTSGFHPSEKVKLTELFELVSEESKVLSEEMFYLSYYGFPEPNFERSWLGSWIWYLIAGAVTVFTGRFLLGRHKGRG